MKNMEVWYLNHTSFLPFPSISTLQVRSYLQLLTHTISLIFLCPCTAVNVIKNIVIWTKKSKTKKSFWWKTPRTRISKLSQGRTRKADWRQYRPPPSMNRVSWSSTTKAMLWRTFSPTSYGSSSPHTIPLLQSPLRGCCCQCTSAHRDAQSTGCSLQYCQFGIRKFSKKLVISPSF